MLVFNSDIIIIGGGAAGLMAAHAAASTMKGISVTLLEKMPRPGRKIMITGKGRCNFTNVKDWNEFQHHIRTKTSFVKPSFYAFTPKACIDFFSSEGLESVVERGDRAYPSSYKSMDVVDTLVRAAEKAGAVIRTGCDVTGITVTEDAVCRFEVNCKDGRVFSCRKLIIATGGLSYPATGSTGDGYGFALKLGHSIKQLFPSLTALVPKGYKEVQQGSSRQKMRTDVGLNRHIARENPLSENGKLLCNQQLKNVGVSLLVDGNPVREEFGELFFTDGGVEGPVGFNLSRDAVKSMINGGKVSLSIDLKSGVEAEEVNQRVRSMWKEIMNDPRSRNLNIMGMTRILLGKLMPWDLVSGFLKWNPEVVVGRRGNWHVDIAKLCSALKDWRFDIDGYVGYERAVVTAGGVDTDQVLPKTMESRNIQGLYFCGEVLDMDCDTGGYNLQAAFCTGRMAGASAAASLAVSSC